LRNRIDEVRAEWTQHPDSDKVPVVILEAAILLDAGWDDILDGVWVVTTSKSIALERLMETRGLSQEEAEKRITAQDSRRGIGNLDEEVKTGVVSGVVENTGSLDDLKTALSNALKDPKSWK
jgi:dephospho-CoA kinase